MEEKAAKAKVGKIQRHHLKKRLLQERGKFESQLEKAEMRWLEVVKGNPIATSSHIGDCTANGDEEVLGKRRENLKKCIEKCDQALSQIGKGSYGICEDCGEDIPIARLQTVPFANLCVPCKDLRNS